MDACMETGREATTCGAVHTHHSGVARAHAADQAAALKAYTQYVMHGQACSAGPHLVDQYQRTVTSGLQFRSWQEWQRQNVNM